MPLPSLLLIHGAATAAWIWADWRRELQNLGWRANVLDLRGHGRSMPIDLSTVTLEDYVADVASVVPQIHASEGVPPVLMGWSMGGMIAMMYASTHADCSALVLVEPSPPLEAGGKASIETVRRFAGDVVRPEQLGIFPDDLARSRQALFDLDEEEALTLIANSKDAEESGPAFRQGLRGISILHGSIDCPVLVVYGDTEGRAEIARQNVALVEHLEAEGLAVPDTGHWGIVAHGPAVQGVAPSVDTWLRRTVGSP